MSPFCIYTMSPFIYQLLSVYLFTICCPFTAVQGCDATAAAMKNNCRLQKNTRHFGTGYCILNASFTIRMLF